MKYTKCIAIHTIHIHPQPNVSPPRGQGCLDEKCTLCKHNPFKVCKDNFGAKYLVGDPLVAKCGGMLRVSLVNPQGNVTTEGLTAPQGIALQVFLVNGAAKGVEEATSASTVGDEVVMLLNNKVGGWWVEKEGGWV